MFKYRTAATLILAVRHGMKSPTSNNYKILCLQRHQKSNHMPGAYVFPGGVIDPSDANLKWNKLFHAHGITKDSFQSLFPTTNQLRPQIFESKDDELPREISLRISAIRETFEECGILICKHPDDNNTPMGWANYVSIPEDQVEYWQHRVHNDATEFYTLCEHLNCYPDLWSLYEWCNWVTPTFMRRRRHYDTIFYIAFLTEMPYCNIETSEIEDLIWETPDKLLSSEKMLPPPQQYELGRMADIKDISNLLDYAITCNQVGVQPNLPVRIKLSDGNINVLPGDSMYPKIGDSPNNLDLDKTNMTINELRRVSKIKNRMEFYKTGAIKILVHNFNNVIPRDGD